MACQRLSLGLAGMAVLAVTSTRVNLSPTVLLQDADDRAHLHSSEGCDGVCRTSGLLRPWKNNREVNERASDAVQAHIARHRPTVRSIADENSFEPYAPSAAAPAAR
jgi:hypothetical protein